MTNHRRIPNLYAMLGAAVCVATPLLCTAQPPARPPSAPSKAPLDISKALNVTQLKIDMAESNFSLRPSPKSLSDLVSALEEYLASTCMKDMLTSLKYEGPPTNPECVSRMEQLLKINPDNPVGICLRDGIEAQTCWSAYQGQLLVKFSSSSSELQDLPDPALKVGLSAQETEKFEALRTELNQMQPSETAPDQEAEMERLKEASMRIYDKMLAIACRIVVLKLDPIQTNKPVAEDPKIVEARTKLLAVPKELRADYQEKMVMDLEEQLHLFKGSDEDREKIKKLIGVVKDPEGTAPVTSDTMLRKRYVLPQCIDMLERTEKNFPGFPSTTCHREGWYSPQCVGALRQWKLDRAKKEREKALKNAKGTPGPKPSIISSF